MLWYIVNGLYLILWSALLVHCLHRREFYPIIGRKWGTKIFWLLTFIFFNPLLSLIYVIFGVILKAPRNQEKPRLIYPGSVIAIVCIGLVIVLFKLPFDSQEVPPVVILSDGTGADNPEGGSSTLFNFEPHIGTIKATNKVQTYSSASTGMDAKVSLRNILLICHKQHGLLDRIAREFQKSLIKLPYVEKVSYYSYKTWPELGGLLPDVYIILDMPEIDEKELFHGRQLQAKIEWQASSSMFGGLTHSFETSSCPKVQFNIESEFNHESKMIGIESPQAKYKLEAKNVTDELIKSIRKQFENLLDKYGEMPQLPDMLYGTYHVAPEFSFIRNENVLRQISGSGLLRDNDTIWQFTDERRTEEALTSYSDELKSHGWTEDDRDKDYLKMRNDEEYIYICRQRRRKGTSGRIVSGNSKKPKSEAPMIARYESCWTKERMQEVMDKLLKSNVDVDTLLVFHEYFRNPEQRECLLSLFEQSPVPSLDGYIVLARFLADRGELEKGRESLMLARAMQYAEKGNNVRIQDIENLAEKLGDGSIAEVAVTEETFRKTGFLNANEIDELTIVERGLDEPLLFYRLLEDGELQTVALRIIRSREPLPLMPYHLLMVEKRQGSSSSSEKEGNAEPNGDWNAESYLYSLTDEGKSMHLKIESLKDEKFRFVITTELI